MEKSERRTYKTARKTRTDHRGGSHMSQSHHILGTAGAMWVVRRRSIPGPDPADTSAMGDGLSSPGDCPAEQIRETGGYTDIFMLPESTEPVTSGIDPSTGHLILSYMEGYLHNEDRLALEWDVINAYETEEATPSEVAELPENRQKNRSQAPLPFEQTRVRLRNTDNDYINASLLFDHSPRNPTYIATPSPLLDTLSDFWQMVWEQTSVIIVCLERANDLKQSDHVSHTTTTSSDASVQYWPNEGVRIYGKFEVHLVSEHNWCEEYVVRSFYLKNLETGETRTVTQFHYLAWNDSDLRIMSKSLLEFRRKVNRSFRGMMSPIIVHCIDGSGRTGTYVLLDLVLNRISKGVREINIAASLEHLRDQRPKMVQTRDQYEFVFAAVAQEVEAMLKTSGHSG